MLDVISLGSCIAELTPADSGKSLAAGGELQLLPAGSSANFCFAAARLGLKVAFISKVGKDELGEFIINRLQGAGVDTSHVLADAAQLTSLSLCWADGRGGKKFYFYRFPGFSDPLAALTSKEVADDFLAQGKLLHFSEAGLREATLREATFELAERFRAAGGKVLYCPNYRGVWREGKAAMLAAQKRAAGLADWLILNDEEAAVITGQEGEKAGAELRGMGPEAVVITQGKNGAELYSPEENVFIPAYEVPVIYDVGAGDTFQAGFVAGRSWGMSFADSVRAGAAAAALRVSRSGEPEHLPTGEAVKHLLSTSPSA